MAETTAPLSEAELRFYLTRATVGAGLGFGIGSDLARATLSILREGEDCLAEVASALEAVESGSSAMRFEPDEGALLGDVGTLSVQSDGKNKGSAIALAVVLGDLAATNVRQVRVRGESIDFPELCARLATALLGPDMGVAVEVTANETRFSVQEIKEPQSGKPSWGGVSVDRGAWQRIMSLFKRCLVPSDEGSRLSSAGAGLVDED